VAGVHPAQGERDYGLMLAPLSFARLLSVKPGSIARNRASASRDSTMLPNRAQAIVNSSTSRLAFVSVMLVECCRRLTNAQSSGAAVYLPPSFFVEKTELDKNVPIHCPKCWAVFRLKSEQMKNLPPGRRPVRDLCCQPAAPAPASS
jgi:hypothetical protein